MGRMMKMLIPEGHLPLNEWAKIRGLKLPTVHTMAATGRIPYLRIGQWIFIRPDAKIQARSVATNTVQSRKRHLKRSAAAPSRPNDELLSISEFSQKWNMTQNQVRYYFYHRRLRAIRHQGRIWIHPDEQIQPEPFTLEAPQQSAYAS